MTDVELRLLSIEQAAINIHRIATAETHESPDGIRVDCLGHFQQIAEDILDNVRATYAALQRENSGSALRLLPRRWIPKCDVELCRIPR